MVEKYTKNSTNYNFSHINMMKKYMLNCWLVVNGGEYIIYYYLKHKGIISY